MATANSSTSDAPGFMDRGFFFILVALLAGGIYTAFFYLWQTELLSLFRDEFSHLIIEAQSQNVKDFFEKYAIYGGVAFALLLIIKSLIPFGLKNLFGLKKNRFANPIVYIIIYGAFTVFAWNIYYYEPHYSAIGIAIIYLIAKPMLYASATITGLMTLVLLKRIIR